MNNIKLFNEFNGELIDDWEKLDQSGDFSIFQSHQWLRCWWNTFKNTNTSLQIVVVKNDNIPLILLPLMITTNALKLKKLTFLAQNYSDYNYAILSKNLNLDNFDFEKIWFKIIKKLPRFDILYFSKQPEKINNFNNKIIFSGKSYFHLKSYHINLKNNWNEYYTGLKSKFRLDSRRQTRKLKQIGELRFFVADSIEDKINITRKMIDQKSRRYDETGVRNIFNEKNNVNFYLNLAKSESLKSMLHISALILNDKIIATHFGFNFKNKFYYLMPTFESGEWRKFSSSRLLLEFLIQYSFESKFQEFDFTIGGETYKKNWCNSEKKYYQTINYFSFYGWFNYKYMILKIKVKSDKKLSKFANFLFKILNIKP